MTNRGAMIAAIAAGLFSTGATMAASAAESAKVHCQGVNSLQGEERLLDRDQRLRRPELLQGQGLDRDERQRLQGQGRHGRQVAGIARSPGAKLEVALADDLAFDEVDQEGAAFADHPVERQQVPDVQRPADVAALARGRPLRGLEIAETRRSDAAVDAQLAERRRRPHDLDGVRGSRRLDLPPPLADQPQPAGAGR